MLSTLMLQNLPDWWVTRDLVAWLGCVRCLAYCVFEGNLAGNFWVGVRCLPAAGGFKTIQKMGGEAPHLFGSFYCPLGFPRPQKLAQQFTARLPSDTQALCDYVVITRTTK